MFSFGLLLLQAAGGAASNPVLNFLPIILIFGIFYFLLMRPMQKQRKDQQQLLANLQNGQVVVTSGGIIGTVIALTADTVTVRVKPDNIKLQIQRSAVSGLAPEETK
ncbi:MAG: preprotein translocase subunit YajC [Candidatus Solibacter usitatus]|nr:preprotein translocase subunit YajC [Candidatus Solibacter usitatus]